MRSIELHVINTASDVDTAIVNGLLEPEQINNGLQCAACSDEVGHITGELSKFISFESFALLIDERDVPWLICYACLEDVIDPQPITVNELSYLYEEEFEQFTLEDEE